MKQISIEPMQAGELRDAAVVAGRAMAPTPFPIAISGGRQDTKRMADVFKMFLGHFPGQVIVAKEEGHVVGVMRMVEWPRCQTTPFQGLRLMPAMITAGLPTLLRGLKGRAIWSKHDPKEPHWHLDPLAVVPDRQGQGIGSQLLKHFCNQVDKRGGAAYLETDRPENVRLYERFGWGVREEATVLDMHCWFMWRPAQK